MANDKKFVVKNGLTAQNLAFVDDITNATNQITISMLGTDTLSFSGDSGQLFSITDSLTGTIFSVNDISGIPSIEVDDDGTIRLAEFAGNILIGTATDDGTNKLQVNGNIAVTGTVDGRDIATDGTKLDTIETNAKDDQTITAGTGLSGGGTGDVTINHSNSVTAGTVSEGGVTRTLAYSGSFNVPSVTYDAQGHITGTTTVALTLPASDNTDTTYSAGNGISLSGTTFNVAAGGGLTQDASGLSHTDTSTQASVNNSNGTVIQDVTLDTYGHVTGLASVDLDGRYVNKSGDTVTGTITIAEGGTIVYDGTTGNAGGYIPYPAGASYRTAGSAQTGAIQIRFPIGTAPSDMLSFNVDVFDYNGASEGESFTAYIYGYNRGPTAAWRNSGATIVSDRTDKDFSVRFGRDASYTYVWIGETNSSWNYTQAVLRDFQVGYTADIADFATGWDISFATSFATVDITASNNYPVAKQFEVARNIALSGDVTGNADFDGSGNITLSTDIAANVVGASELNVSGNGTTSQFLRSDGDGTFTWATPTNTTYSAGNGIGLSGTTFSVAAGGGLTQDASGLSHTDTSTQASLTALTGANVVSDIDLDTYGHVTSLATRTMTLADLGYTGETNATADQTITAGTGLSGGGTGNVTINHSNSITAGTVSEGGVTRTLAQGGSFNVPSITYDAQGHITSTTTVALTLPESGGATISATAPTSPSEGELWWDTDAGKLFIYYIDGDTSQWVEASPSQNPFTYDTQTDTYSTSSSISAKDFNSTSDQRLKENIQDLTVDYDILNSIRSVSFDWKDTGNSAYGFIAQELEDVLPELVATNSDTSYKSVSYTQLIPHLLEAIKDLKNQVDELKEKI